MAAPRKSPDELRERATRLAVDPRRDPATRAGALRRVSEQQGIPPETLRNWVVQAEVDAGARPDVSTDEARKIAELEREVRELRRANEILRTASVLLPRRSWTPNEVIVAYIDTHRDRLGVEPIRRVLAAAGTQIAPSTYYAAKTRPRSARGQRHRNNGADRAGPRGELGCLRRP